MEEPDFSFSVPHQPAVYVLWGSDKERPLYIGMSRGNIVGRVTQHLQKPWGREIESVDVYLASDTKDMRAMELRFIRQHNPIYNVGDGGTAPRRPRVDSDPLERDRLALAEFVRGGRGSEWLDAALVSRLTGGAIAGSATADAVYDFLIGVSPPVLGSVDAPA